MVSIPDEILPKPQFVRYGGSYLIVRDLKLLFEEELLDPAEARFLVEEVLGTRVSSESSASFVVHGIEGAARHYRLPSSQEAYVVEISPKTSQIDVYVQGRRAFVNALATIRQLSQLKDGRLKISEANVADHPLFQLRGVVEGFYYDPWLWDERRKVIKRLSMFKMNSYIYAPKHDPYHREKWRESYPDDWINEFRGLTSTCKRWHIDFFFALSPGLSVIYSSEEDEELLVKKFLEMSRLGVIGFCLFLDDIPEKLAHSEDIKRYSSLAEAQADLVNRVFRRLREAVPEAKMIFCPTRYAGTDLGDYFQELCRLMDKNVLIMWTGPQVCSKSITLGDAENIEKEAKNRLVIWDNYPVNDYARNRLNLGPLRGRDPHLHKLIRGIFSNPMNEPHASLLPLATFADYLWNPEGYDADESWERSLRLLYGNCSGDVAFFSRQLGNSILWPEEPREIEYLRSYARDLMITREISNYFSKLSSLRRKLEECGKETLSFVEETSRYLTKLHLYGEAGLRLLMLSDKLDDERAFEHWLEFLRSLISAEDIQEAAGEVPYFDETSWRISSKKFLCELLLLAIRGILKRRGWPSLLQMPFSTIRYNVDGCSPWHMIDGRIDTAYRSTRKVRPMEVVGVDLGVPLPIYEVHIAQGRQKDPKGAIEGLLQYSMNGEDWKDLSEIRTPIFGMQFDNLRARYLRILADKATERPVSIPLFLIRTSPYKVNASKGSRTVPYCLVDGRLDTYFEFRPAEPGDWVLIDLGKIKGVNDILVFQDPRYFARELRVLGSKEGERYELLGKVRRIVQLVQVKERFRYLKLEIGREQCLARIYQVHLTSDR